MPNTVEEYGPDGQVVSQIPENAETEVNQDDAVPETPGVQDQGTETDDPTAPKESDTETIRAMRTRFKEIRAEKLRLQKENEELKAKIPQNRGELREPTMEECNFDAKEYRNRMIEYTKKVVEQEQQKTEQQKAQEEADASWQASLSIHNAKKASIPNFEEAEFAIDATLSPIQKGIIIAAGNDSAALMFEIGNDDELLSQLSKIKDLTKFAAKIGELNARTKKSTVTKPEPRITAPSAAVAISTGADKKLEALRAEADKTGDYSQVHAYKRALARGGK